MTQASGQLVGLYAELIGAVLPNISHPNKDIQAVAKEANAALLNLQPSAELPVKVEVAPVLAIISRELRSEQEPTHLEALRWYVWHGLGYLFLPVGWLGQQYRRHEQPYVRDVPLQCMGSSCGGAIQVSTNVLICCCLFAGCTSCWCAMRRRCLASWRRYWQHCWTHSQATASGSCCRYGS